MKTQATTVPPIGSSENCCTAAAVDCATTTTPWRRLTGYRCTKVSADALRSLKCTQVLHTFASGRSCCMNVEYMYYVCVTSSGYSTGTWYGTKYKRKNCYSWLSLVRYPVHVCIDECTFYCTGRSTLILHTRVPLLL